MFDTKYFDRSLDKLIRVEVRVFGGSRSPYQVCGLIGLGLSLLLVAHLIQHQNLSLWIMATTVLTGVVTFFGLALLTKIITGSETLIYYHHEIAIVCTTSLLLWALRQPILPYLDATILGIGMFLVCGRIGCLMVGCCYGRPHRWGVCYGHEHAAAGFTPQLVGVRLFPIQAIESMWVLVTVLIGSVMILRGTVPGMALAWYSITYNLGRFFFEFMRGDAERPYYCGFSEPQWISVVLAMLVITGDLMGVLPLQTWHLAVTIFLVGTMIFVVIKGSGERSGKFQLLRARHILEVARAVDSETAPFTTVGRAINPEEIPVSMTSLGFQISCGKVESSRGQIVHYTLSHHSQKISFDSVRTIAKLILQLRHPAASGEILSRGGDIYHIVVLPKYRETNAS